MSRLPFESEYLYGFHDPGGEGLMRDARVPGWADPEGVALLTQAAVDVV